MERQFRQIAQLAHFLVLPWLVACGAPTKSAGDVANIFAGDSVALQDKTDAICNELRTRSEAPTVKGLSIDLGCDGAGLLALDYQKLGTGNNPDGFFFSDTSGGSDGVTETKDGDTFHKSLRAQVWLNKGLLGLAQAIGTKMKANSDLENGVLDLPDSSGGRGLGGLATPKITVLQKPDFDIENLKFAMKINLKITGIVEADHDIQIDGQMIDKVFAVTVKTTEDRAFKQSIIKNFTAVMLIVPHASDVYLDLFADLTINSPGFDGAIESQVNSILGTGLKGAIDSLMVL